MYLIVKKLSETATIPTRGSEKSAGLDLYAAENCVVFIGQINVHILVYKMQDIVFV